jgi:hypothetical protein
VWARVHKIDRVRPQPDGSAIVLVEDERTQGQMARVPSLTTLVAIARIVNGRRILASKFGGKGEVRYAVSAPPSFLTDAIQRAGASVSDAKGERVTLPPQPASISATVDSAFADLAHYVRAAVGAQTIADALKRTEANRRKAPLDRDANPAGYWTSVFELMALAGELQRKQGGRWIESTEQPVPFALALEGNKVVTPSRFAQQVVEGHDPDQPLAVADEP